MKNTAKVLLAFASAALLTGVSANAAETLRIGLAAPLTGDYAPYSEARGAECMAATINNSDSPVKVEIMMEDSRSDPQLTLSLAQKYLDAAQKAALSLPGGAAQVLTINSDGSISGPGGIKLTKTK